MCSTSEQPRRRSKHAGETASGGTSRTGSSRVARSSGTRYRNTAHCGASSMIEAGVGRRSAKPPRNTLSKTLAAALEAWVGVGMSEVMAMTNDDPTGQNSPFSRDFASGGLEELQQKRHNALVRLDLRAM